MASYYEQVQEAIKNNEKELAHLKDELRGLRTVEKDTPRENFQRQYAQILYHIDQEQKRLAENQTLLDNYHAARDGIVELRETRDNDGLDDLRALLATEKNPQTRRQIMEELEEKEREHATKIETLETTVQTSIAGLTDELAEELRQSILAEDQELEETDKKTHTEEVITENINEQKETDAPTGDGTGEETATDDVVAEEKEDVVEESVNPNNETTDKEHTEQPTDKQEAHNEQTITYQELADRANRELQEAEATLQASITRFQEIFEEERTRQENEGPFRTVEELDDFRSEYMRQKIEENERFEAAQARVARARQQLKRLEEKIAYTAELEEQARAYDVDPKTYEKIRKAVSQKEVLSAIYAQRGLGEVYRRTKAGKEQANKITEELVQSIIEQLKSAGIQTSSATQENVTQNGAVNINQNGGTNINIIDTINIIYGTDIPVKGGPSRTITINSEEKENVQQTQRSRVKVKVVPHNGNEQEGKTPGKAPEDMPMESGKLLEDKPIESENESENMPIESENEPENMPMESVKEDGTYRLTRDQIIQDEPITPTGTKEGNKDGDDKGENIDIYGGPQVLYGPPTVEPSQVVKVPGNDTPEEPTPSGKTGDGDDKGENIDIYRGPQVLYGPPQVEPHKVVEKPEEKKTPKRGLMTIMDELTDGLGLKKKDGKRFKASNIKVFKGFKEELSSGNYLYNIVHLIPAVVKLPFNLIRKATGKIMLRAESKRNIAELKKRLDKLSEEDLMTIYTEYRGNKVMQERFPTILNTLIEERIQRFALSKVTEINGELEQRYQSAFAAMNQLNAINAELTQEGLSENRRRELENAKSSVLGGQAENIATIRSRYIEANNWMSGGLHGFSEDMKAATTKLSLVGKRFAKDHDLNPELLQRQAALERAEMQAIADGNDEMALRVFVENERLLSENTEIKGSVFGRRSTGEKYYSPLVEQLDYRDDPFVRDLFTTIAVSSAAISTIQSIKAAREQAEIIAENNRIIADNNQTFQQVNQIGQDIADKRSTMMEGMQSQGMQDTLTSANEIERAVLDKTNWGLGTNAYRTADHAGHTYYTTFFDSTKQAYENIAQQYASGQINQAQAMQMMADLGTKTHQTFGAINTECLNILKPYAQTHPQFDLTGVQGAMEYLQANPSAVDAMNQAMVDVTNAGDVLASMQLQQLVPLTTLPADVRTVIINGAATAALASNINNSMGARKHTYGNAVTDMVDEYSASQREQAEQRGNTPHR